MVSLRGRTAKLMGVFSDPKTGEVVEATHVLLPRRQKVKDWLMWFHRGSKLLAKDKDLTGEAFRVFHYAISEIDYENKLLVTQAEIAEALEMKQPHVSRAFKLLVSKGILEEGEKVGRIKTYYLNWDFGWKGSTKNLIKRAQNDLEGLSKASA